MLADKMDQTVDEVAVTTLRCQSKRILVLDLKVRHFQEFGECRDNRAWLKPVAFAKHPRELDDHRRANVTRPFSREFLE